MARTHHQLPEQWRDELRRVARETASADGNVCPPTVSDRIADAVLDRLLSLAEVEEHVRDRPLMDPMPPRPRPSHYATERRLAICTPAEPCASYSLDSSVDPHGHLWYPVVGSNPASKPPNAQPSHVR
ncbi:hypothetical protein GCM10018962_14320 [Dactylosporangium matsuzakiense]|uniref:Uncharacterized protein n=1 Tax=Dactylosporangium matsuzakiense TaxID=53360 RepID=A0A9W6KV45_9ACTN|nr:hypothetical protein GCM10017581_104090 [Dactylosporangium matsuzakiense]